MAKSKDTQAAAPEETTAPVLEKNEQPGAENAPAEAPAPAEVPAPTQAEAQAPAEVPASGAPFAMRCPDIA